MSDSPSETPTEFKQLGAAATRAQRPHIRAPAGYRRGKAAASPPVSSRVSTTWERTRMDFTDRTRHRLARNTVAWFTTVNPKGRPITLPVWFLWDGDTGILIYSLSNAARLRNIETNPNVSLHLDGDHHGGEVVVLEGTAAVDPDQPPATAVSEYLDRYRGYIAAYGWTPEWFADRYPVAIRMQIDNVRAW